MSVNNKTCFKNMKQICAWICTVNNNQTYLFIYSCTYLFKLFQFKWKNLFICWHCISFSFDSQKVKVQTNLPLILLDEDMYGGILFTSVSLKLIYICCSLAGHKKTQHTRAVQYTHTLTWTHTKHTHVHVTYKIIPDLPPSHPLCYFTNDCGNTNILSKILFQWQFSWNMKLDLHPVGKCVLTPTM